MAKSRILDTKDACKYLKISRKTYQKYIKEGWINAFMDGNKWMVEVEELNRYLKEGASSVDIKSLQPKSEIRKNPSNVNSIKNKEKPYSYDPQRVLDSFKNLDLTLPPRKNMSLDEYRALIVNKTRHLPHIREEHVSVIEDYARECVIVEAISNILQTKRDSVLLGDNPSQDENAYLLKDYEAALARKIKLADELLLTPKSQAKLHPEIWKKLFVYSEIEIAENIWRVFMAVIENDEILGRPFYKRITVIRERMEWLMDSFVEARMTFEEWEKEILPKIREEIFSGKEN